MFARQSVGHGNRQFVLPLRLVPISALCLEMLLQRLAQTLRQGHRAVFVAFSGAHHDEATIKIDILNAQTLCLEKSQTRS